MIGELKPYPRYKDSGLPWLEQMPAHWTTLRNGNLFAQRNETGRSDLPILEVSLKTGVRVREFGEGGRKQVMAELGKYKRAAKGDLAYNTMRMWQGALGVTPVDGLVSPAYVVARPYANIEPRYFAALFRTGAYMAEIDSASRGIVKDRNRLYWEQFKQMRSLCPPPDEQAAIVRFLDWANGRLERAIRAKRKVIALLDEQKQAIIHRAVTRGLDPSVPLKPSGVLWFGDVPKHWDVLQVRHVGRLLKGTGGSKEDAVEAGIPCVRYGELYMRYKSFIRETRTFVSPARAVGYTPIVYGDVLFAASGEKVNEIGKSAVNLMKNSAVCGGDVVVLRPTCPTHAPFLGYAFDSYGVARQKAAMCRGTTIKHIYPDELRGLYVCFPPIDEQEAIATVLDAKLQQLNHVIARLEREIALLLHYRTRLIADVVTGKLDVLDAAPAAESITDAAADPADDAEPVDEEAPA